MNLKTILPVIFILTALTGVSQCIQKPLLLKTTAAYTFLHEDSVKMRLPVTVSISFDSSSVLFHFNMNGPTRKMIFTPKTTTVCIWNPATFTGNIVMTGSFRQIEADAEEESFAAENSVVTVKGKNNLVTVTIEKNLYFPDRLIFECKIPVKK